MPRHHHGNLVVRDILTPLQGDPLKPERKGAVCMVIERLSHATLQPGERTSPATLTDTQEIYYVAGGSGTITSGGTTAELYEGVGVLMPPEVEFSIACTGTALEMYLVTEPVPAGFTPRTDMLVRDENVLPIYTTTGHWTHINKRLFRSEDGLATLSGMGPVWFEGNTMGQPHSHPEGVEEIWFSVEGNPNIFVGKQIRDFSPGTAYKIPADGNTPHSTINTGTDPIKVFWMMRSAPGSEPLPYSRLAPEPYDPATDPDYAMFMGSWLDNHPYSTHGSLVERDILTKGDPDHPARKGAVLRYVNRFTHAMLHPHGSTLPTTLDGEQEIFYILAGEGTITDGKSTASLHPGIGVLMPPGVEFTMTNTGEAPLTMYLISEPVVPGFQPLGAMKVVDESGLPLGTTNPHWVGCSKSLFSSGSGLSTLTSVLTVRPSTATLSSIRTATKAILRRSGRLSAAT